MKEELLMYIGQPRYYKSLSLKLEPGKYKYIQQVEYDPYQDVIREVYD